MFTGLIEGRGTIGRLAGDRHGMRLRVDAAFLGTPGRGESIAVDGVCLTATECGPGWFEAVLTEETLSRTTLGGRSEGGQVDLERPLRLGDRLGGHLVQGHVDGVGDVVQMRPEAIGARIRIVFPDALSPLIVEKGSIAVDGISLTVASRGGAWLEVALIPETLAVTTIGLRSPGDPVNLEVDIIGRYVQEALRGRDRSESSAVTRDLLTRHGFSVRQVLP